jgi:hypothetical protein
MKKLPLISFILALPLIPLSGQGLNIPAKHWGLSFGNSTRFDGLRFNIIDKDVDKINGMNVNVWGAKDDDRQTGTVNGISIGIPAAIGTNYRHGINIGIFGAGARQDMNGINIGGLGVGAGNNLKGINLGGLGAGAGNDVKGITFGILGAGAGNDMMGINIGGLGVGAGGNVSGLNFGGLAVGSGGSVKGLSMSLLAVGSGEEVAGISLAGLAVGGPKVSGIQAALVVGGEQVQGISIAPAYFRIEGLDGHMKGFSVSAFNHIEGDVFGVCIGIFNWAYAVRGFQLGILNHVKSNPKALRWLPIFNTSFGS